MPEQSGESRGGPGISKQEIRARAIARRKALAGKEAASRAIRDRFLALEAFDSARTVFLYLHMADEVRTDELVDQLLASGKRLAIPYCSGGVLHLFHMKDRSELAAGHFGILEPRAELRGDPSRRVAPETLDLLAVPGVAFDRRGGRVGHGRAYFDRLLPLLRAETLAAGLAFECQLFPEVPMDSHDVFLDMVLTEYNGYVGRGRADRR